MAEVCKDYGRDGCTMLANPAKTIHPPPGHEGELEDLYFCDACHTLAMKLWSRIEEGDQDLTKEIAQGSLVSHMDFVVAVLDFLEIPHDGHGFFEKDAEATDKLADGWQARVFGEFKESHPVALVLLYINHLDWEMSEPTEVFTG